MSKQNSKSITQCVCDAGFYKEYSVIYAPAYWYCRVCMPGEVCYDNMNKTCPEHAFSYGSARSYTDCFCNPGFKNTTGNNSSSRTELAFCEDCPASSFCTGKGLVEACTAHAVSPVQSAAYTACTCDLGYKGQNNTPCSGCDSPKFCYSGLEATCSEGTFSPPLSFDRLNCSCIAGKRVFLSM